MVERFRAIVAYRKRATYLRVYDPRVIDNAIDVSDLDNAIHLSFVDKNLIAPRSEIHYFINPAKTDCTYWAPTPLQKRHISGTNNFGGEDPHAVTIPARSVMVCIGENDKAFGSDKKK